MEIIIRTERTMEDFFLESSYEIIDLSVLTAHCYRDQVQWNLCSFSIRMRSSCKANKLALSTDLKQLQVRRNKILIL